jgi:hypothetical protein
VLVPACRGFADRAQKQNCQPPGQKVAAKSHNGAHIQHNTGFEEFAKALRTALAQTARKGARAVNGRQQATAQTFFGANLVNVCTSLFKPNLISIGVKFEEI